MEDGPPIAYIIGYMQAKVKPLSHILIRAYFSGSDYIFIQISKSNWPTILEKLWIKR